MVTILDALAIYKPWKGFQPAWLYFAVGLAAIAKGVFVSKLPGLWRLIIFSDGFKIRTSPCSSLKSKWNETETLVFDGARIRMTPKNGKLQSLKLRGIGNASEAADVLLDAARANNVSAKPAV